MSNRPAICDDKHLDYLDALRESGITNTYGSPRYLQDTYGLNKKDAFTIVQFWMDTFSERHPKELPNV